MAMNLQSVRGTKDLFGEEIQKFNHIIQIARNIAKLYNFNELQTPILEFSDVFERNLGDDSDIVHKEIYKFEDRGGNILALRPEFTASVARSFIEHNMHSPIKLFSFGPLFRYDRPQKGRQRQFHQINFENIGNSDNDAEVIEMANFLLQALKLKSNIILEINSLASGSVKIEYQKSLVNYLINHKSELSEDSQRRLVSNPLRILDSKDAKDKAILGNAPLISEFYSNDDKLNFSRTLDSLNTLDIEYKINPHLVRGLDYYNGVVFEFISNDLGAQSTILAGGRYDNLIGLMCGRTEVIPAIGFASGIERLALLLEYNETSIPPICIVSVSSNEDDAALLLASRLRESGCKVEIIYGGNIKKKMKRANQIEVQHVIIIGEDEVKNNNYLLKNMTSGEEVSVDLQELLKYLNQLVK